MNSRLFTEDKIDLLQLAFNNIRPYSSRSYGLLDKTRRVLESLITQEDVCINKSCCMERLEILISDLERQITMKENYEAVIMQVNFAD